MSEQVEIVLKQIESPSEFNFLYESDKHRNAAQGIKERKKIEAQISEHYSNNTLRSNSNSFVPSPNSIVGYLHTKWMSWVRGRVISRNSDGTFRIYLLDYGHDYVTDDSSVFTDIPDNLKRESTLIKQGSLGLKPCERVKDSNGLLISRPIRYWNKKAIEFIKNFDRPNESRKFYLELYKILPDGKHVGDIIMKTTHDTVSLSKKLIADGYAIREEGLVPQVPKSADKRPIANFEKLMAVLNGENYLNAESKVTTKPPLMLPAGVNVRSFTSKREEIREVKAKPAPETTPEPKATRQPSPIASKNQSHEVMSTPSPLRTSCSLKTPPVNAYKPPTTSFAHSPLDIFAFGERLIVPLQSIESGIFTKSIESRLKERPMTKLQSHCWSQIVNCHSVVIVEENTIFKSPLLNYLPALLNTLKHQQVKSGVGPVAVVIVKTSHEAKNIEKFCSDLLEDLSIVVAAGPIDTKFELMNGCDLLIATPPAFCRLIDNIVKGLIFDKDRIKHLIFHQVDTMISRHESEINAIIRTCTKKDKPEQNPQIIVTSSRWMEEIRKKLMILIHSKDVVVCIENFLEAAAFAGCDVQFVTESKLNVEGKNKKLKESLEKGVYKAKRTVVVTNDEASSKNLFEYLKKTTVNVLHADKENFKCVKTEWMQQREGKFHVLITSDASLKGLELRNVENLIHFNLPSMEKFSQRFVALIEKIYASLRKKTVQKPSITIFLEDENVGTFAALITFMHSRQMVNVPEDKLEIVKQIKLHREVTKGNANILICNRVWCFGECLNDDCSFRHVFTKADKPLNYLPVATLIKFELVYLEKPTDKDYFGPTSYFIKIMSQMKGADWCSWEERNDKIEKFISEDLQEFYANPLNQKPANSKLFHETYAVKHNDKWFRCKVMEISRTPLSSVYLIDSGNRCHVKELFELPDAFKLVEPLVCKLQILNLVPFDSEDKWSIIDKETQSCELQKNTNGCTFTCKVQMAIHDVLFTESFEAKDNITGSVKCRLRKDLLKTNFCSEDVNIIKKLRKLALDGNLLQLRKTLIKPENNYDDETFTNNQFIQESWKFLSCESYYEAHVKHFENPESFLVVIDSADKKTQKEVIKEIENCATRIPLENVEVGAICAVGEAKIRRGKILNINEDIVEVLLVDFGDIVKCQKSELFELPQKLMTKLTFQTIHCRLIGLRPRFRMVTWPSKQITAVRQLIHNSQQPLKMYVEKKSEKTIEKWDKLGMNFYDVILINSDGSVLADVAVKGCFADPVEYKKPSDMDEVLDSGNASDDEVEGLNKIEILKRMMIGDDGNDESYDEDSIIQNTEVNVEESRIQDKEESEGNIDETSTSTLKYIHKHPKIEWRQNDIVVYLLVSAIDCEDYALKINDFSVTIAIKYRDDFEKTTIELYSGIDSKLSSYELRGLNVIIRLMKKKSFNKWPRLTDKELNCLRKQFIKASLEKITKDLEELRLEEPRRVSKYRNCVPEDFYNSSDDDEESLCLSDNETIA